ncbi:MAG: thermonuclease family protein [Proteobacteria bacterium]|nr:thermonuclease family protein [Pseudomonadota bacterium]
MADVTGPARIIDGDTIHIGKTKIRLHGIDAPEMKQICKRNDGKPWACGVAATQALRKMVGSQAVTCKGNTRDRYKRLIAVCYVGTFNINEQMVTDGWALAYRKYSKDYVRAEMLAKSQREGVWGGEFEMPWEWRQK